MTNDSNVTVKINVPTVTFPQLLQVHLSTSMLAA